MKGNLILLLVAAIWGTGFVAQKAGMEHIGPFTYSAARYFFGCISLLPLLIYFQTRQDKKKNLRKTLQVGIGAGIIMFIAVSLQQVGIMSTSVGKASFITCMYIILVPMAAVFMHRRVAGVVWLGAVMALMGLYMLCVKGGFVIEYGDWLIFACAIFWTVHIIYIDRYTSEIDSVTFAFVQFASCMLISAVVALGFEEITWSGLCADSEAILYGGFAPVGIAYTLQIVGQKYAEPATAAIIMSMESVFGALAGYIFLDEIMASREILGCLLMTIGMFVAQSADLFNKTSKRTAGEEQ